MPWVPVAVAVNAVLLVAGVAVPPLRDLLGTEPLTSGEFVVAMAAALVPATLDRLARRGPGRRIDTSARRQRRGVNLRPCIPLTAMVPTAPVAGTLDPEPMQARTP